MISKGPEIRPFPEKKVGSQKNFGHLFLSILKINEDSFSEKK
jgi:hypothetical protein